MIQFLEPHIDAVLAEFVPDPPTLCPTGCRASMERCCPAGHYEGHPELYSGKHHTTGHVVQVARDLVGDVRVISDPYPRFWHDVHSYAETG